MQFANHTLYGARKIRFSERFSYLRATVRKSVETVPFHIQFHIRPIKDHSAESIFILFFSPVHFFNTSFLPLFLPQYSFLSCISLTHQPPFLLHNFFFHSSYYSSGVTIGEVFPAVSLSSSAMGAVKQALCLTDLGQQRGKLNLHPEPVLT